MTAWLRCNWQKSESALSGVGLLDEGRGLAFFHVLEIVLVSEFGCAEHLLTKSFKIDLGEVCPGVILLSLEVFVPLSDK